MTEFLKAPEVAQRLAVSREQVYRWAQGYKIPCVRLPGRVLRFDAGALEAWIVQKTMEAK